MARTKAVNPRKKILKSGKVSWEARYRDPTGKLRSKTFRGQREALVFLDEERSKIRRGEWVDPADSSTRVSELAEAWITQAPSESTAGVRRNMANNLGDMTDLRLSQVTPPLVRTWAAQLKNGRPWIAGCKGVSASYQSSIFSQFKAMMEQAEEDKLIARNPAEKVSVPRPQTAVTWDDIPTVKELHAFIDLFTHGGKKRDVPTKDGGTEKAWMLPHPDLALAIHLSAATGMRASEVCGLTRPVLDWGASQIRVINQANRFGEGLSELKTRDKGLRTISVDKVTMKLVREHIKLHPGETRILFNKGGRPLVGGSFAQSIRQACRYLGVTKTITPKSFRHFHATELLRAGVPVKTVQARLGHASATMTLNTYAHVAPQDDGQAAAAIGGILSGVGFSWDFGDSGRGASGV